jgi:hypothetical protein
MRPPGYVRRLSFDTLDHLLAAAGIDREAWHGLRVVDDGRDGASDPFGSDRLDDRVPQFAKPRI